MTYAPWSGTVHGSRLYGRGAFDKLPAELNDDFRAQGWAGDAEQPFVRLLGQVFSDVVGEPLRPAAFAGTADARYFGAGGQVAFFGPAGGNQHAPDEYVDLDSVVSVARVIALLMVEWCA